MRHPESRHASCCVPQAWRRSRSWPASLHGPRCLPAYLVKDIIYFLILAAVAPVDVEAMRLSRLRMKVDLAIPCPALVQMGDDRCGPAFVFHLLASFIRMVG